MEKLGRVLVVDDEDGIREIISEIIAPYASTIDEASDGVEALRCIEREKPSLILTDIRMPNLDGIGLLEAIASKELNIPSIVITGVPDRDLIAKSLNLGAVDFFSKPVIEKELLGIVRSYFEVQETDESPPPIEELISGLESAPEREHGAELAAIQAEITRMRRTVSKQGHRVVFFFRALLGFITRIRSSGRCSREEIQILRDAFDVVSRLSEGQSPDRLDEVYGVMKSTGVIKRKIGQKEAKSKISGNKNSVQIPPDREVIAIGDVHGCQLELAMLLNKLPIESNTLVVFLGDLVDRGPSSRATLDTVLQFKKMYPETVILRGNHEEMLLAYLEDKSSYMGQMYLSNGGEKTLEEYGAEGVSADHAELLRGTLFLASWKEMVFVHAGLPKYREGILLNPNPNEKTNMVWTRSHVHLPGWPIERIAHGHEITKEPLFRSDRIGLDTGCYTGNKLSALHFSTNEVFSVSKQNKQVRGLLRSHESRVKSKLRDTNIPVYIYSGDELHFFSATEIESNGFEFWEYEERGIKFKRGDTLKGIIAEADHYEFKFEATVVDTKSKGGAVVQQVEFIESVTN